MSFSLLMELETMENALSGQEDKEWEWLGHLNYVGSESSLYSDFTSNIERTGEMPW